MNLMKELENDSIDMTLTSPPYDNLRNYKIEKSSNLNVKEIAEELLRITKDGGVVIWNIFDQTIDGSETGTSFRHALTFMEVGWKLNDTMIYVKENPMPTSGNRYNQSWEYLFCFSKGTPKTFNPIKKPVIYKGSSTSIRNYNKEGNRVKKTFEITNNEKKIGNVFSYVIGGNHSTKDKIAHLHPAIMHEQLAIDQIKTWSNKDDLVFDPFSGSGTTAKACVLLERKFIGSELNEEYCKIFVERLENYILNEELFS